MISVGKRVGQDGEGEKPKATLLILEPVGGGPKFLIDRTLSEESILDLKWSSVE